MAISCTDNLLFNIRSLFSIGSENVSNFLSNAEVISSFNICAGVPTTVFSIVNACPSSEMASVTCSKLTIETIGQSVKYVQS